MERISQSDQVFMHNKFSFTSAKQKHKLTINICSNKRILQIYESIQNIYEHCCIGLNKYYLLKDSFCINRKMYFLKG